MSPNIESLLETALHLGKTKVVFTKVDGSIRELNCTLNSSIIGTYYSSNSDKPKRITPDDLIAVYDVDAEAWKSFKRDNVIRFKHKTEDVTVKFNWNT